MRGDPHRWSLGDRQVLKAFGKLATDLPEFAILVAIWAHVNEAHTAWPSYKTIAKLAHVSVRTVERRIPKLKERGLFERTLRRSSKAGPVVRTEYHFRESVLQRALTCTDTESVQPAGGVPRLPSESRHYADTVSSPYRQSVDHVATPCRHKKPRKDFITKPGKDAPRPFSHVTKKGIQPPFEEILQACRRNGVRGSNWDAIEQVCEREFGFSPSELQLKTLERQITDRSGE